MLALQNVQLSLQHLLWYAGEATVGCALRIEPRVGSPPSAHSSVTGEDHSSHLAKELLELVRVEQEGMQLLVMTGLLLSGQYLRCR